MRPDMYIAETSELVVNACLVPEKNLWRVLIRLKGQDQWIQLPAVTFEKPPTKRQLVRAVRQRVKDFIKALQDATKNMQFEEMQTHF